MEVIFGILDGLDPAVQDIIWVGIIFCVIAVFSFLVAFLKDRFSFSQEKEGEVDNVVIDAAQTVEPEIKEHAPEQVREIREIDEQESFQASEPAVTAEQGLEYNKFKTKPIESLPTLLAHISNCSTAAALKVSAAATITLFLSFLNLLASFPIDVVFPTPLTPAIIITVGFESILIGRPSALFSMFKTSSLRASLICIVSLKDFLSNLSSILSLSFIVVLTPISLIISVSSNSPHMSSSISLLENT